MVYMFAYLHTLHFRERSIAYFIYHFCITLSAEIIIFSGDKTHIKYVDLQLGDFGVAEMPARCPIV